MPQTVAKQTGHHPPPYHLAVLVPLICTASSPIPPSNYSVYLYNGRTLCFTSYDSNQIYGIGMVKGSISYFPVILGIHRLSLLERFQYEEGHSSQSLP